MTYLSKKAFMPDSQVNAEMGASIETFAGRKTLVVVARRYDKALVILKPLLDQTA